MADVDVSGPFFGADRDRLTEAGIREAQYDVAAQAYSYTAAWLNSHIKVPTPYYETQVTTEWQGADRVVHDRGIVYGPWLEGISERNRTTRFRGYASFRRARDAVRADVPRLCRNAMDRLTDRLGG